MAAALALTCRVARFSTAHSRQLVRRQWRGNRCVHRRISADARNCWWNHPSGPTTPRNPGGQGDSIVGAGEPGVQFVPFLTSPPDFNNTPPVVRLIGPGLTQLYASPDLQIPDFLLDQGTKYIVRWTAQDDDAIASQRIDFSPDGHFPDRYSTLVSNIPASARYGDHRS